MDKEKNLDAGKKENQPQEKAADELLNETELAKVAGGVGGISWYPPKLKGNIVDNGDAGSNGH